MNLKYLGFFLATLFILFGAIAVANEGADEFPLWAGLAVLSLGGFGLAMVGDAFKTGELRLHYSIIQRASQPRLFWSGAVFLGAMSNIVVIVGFWVLTKDV